MSTIDPNDLVLPWSHWDDVVETELRVNAYPYGGGIAQSGVQLTLGRRHDGQIMAVRLPEEATRRLALVLLGAVVPPAPPLVDDPVAKRLGLVPCCDMHNEHCEPPGDLCCAQCSEAAHNAFPIRHADGTTCVMETQ